MNAAAERLLAKAENCIAKGDGWYEKAAQYIEAAMEADSTLSETAVGKRLDRSRTWVRNIRNNLTAGGQVNWERGSHATLAEVREGAAKILGNTNETKKLLAALPEEAREKLASAVVNAPEMSQPLHLAYDRKLHEPGDVRITEPKFPLLQTVRGDHRRLVQAAQLMAGHWHDRRHELGEEEEELVRDEMADAVIEVEKTITAALRGGEKEGVV